MAVTGVPSFYPARSRSWFWRSVVLLAGLLFLLALVAGGIIATNYKHFGNLFKVVSLINARYLEPVNATSLVDGAIRGVVEALGDPYSVYLDPKMFAQLEEQISGSFGGLGIVVTIKDGKLTVVRAYPGTPAKRNGIAEGDVILRINDRDTQGLDLETAVGLMRGPVGSKIKLQLTRKGSTSVREVEIVREQISVPTVEGYMIPGTAAGYLALTQFTTKTPEEVDAALARLQEQGMKGLLLDLRDNPGGELRAAVKVAEHFVPRGPVVYIDYRTGKDETYTVSGNKLNLPLVVLVNRASASAAEILAGAIKDTGSGILVGEKTFGKGVVQELFRLDNGAGLKLTTARYLTPAKHDINKKGIEPDVPVAPGTGSEDVQLQKAVEILTERINKAA
ncbi:MAG: S41 family peptidase [Desulfotomaculales bacterium]